MDPVAAFLKPEQRVHEPLRGKRNHEQEHDDGEQDEEGHLVSLRERRLPQGVSDEPDGPGTCEHGPRGADKNAEDQGQSSARARHPRSRKQTGGQLRNESQRRSP